MREALAAHGYALQSGVFSFNEANQDPWGFAERILGEPPALVERQPIRPIPNGRSFASGMMDTPLHTDSQLALGVPPAVQLMLCVNPAERGGESLFVDTWPLLDTISKEDPALNRELFEVSRQQPFLFGDVLGPTVSRRCGHVVFTHSALAQDPLSKRLQPFVARAPMIEVRPATGDLLLVNNHRMLHGRRAFEDSRREFVRLLVYCTRPLPAPDWVLQRAKDVLWERGAAPLSAKESAIVDEMISGVPPGLLAHREQIPEAKLYAWRDSALSEQGLIDFANSPRGLRLRGGNLRRPAEL